MKLLEKILLATDFSQAAEDAMQMAVLLAKTFDSEITPIHVIPEIQDSPLSPNMLKKMTAKMLKESQDTITNEGIKTAEAVVVFGVPSDQIIHQADSKDVNVIIMGSAEKEREEGSQLGITAQRVARKANKPVWVVKRGSKPAVEKILCPVDLSDPSARALANAIHLARNFQAELTVLMVIQQISNLYPGIAKVAAEKQVTYAKKEESLFDKFLQQFDFHNVNWKELIRQGKPNKEILTIAGEMKSDLLVMGSVGRTGLSRILMGSVAERVIREMPCSVITVKSEHAIRLRLEEEIDHIETHCKHGRQLLEKGFPTEAISEFQHCILDDKIYAPAWDGLAEAHKRLGHQGESKKYTEKAKYIRKRVWEKQVQDEARKHLGRKKR